MRFISARSALGRGLGEGLPSPRKSISLKKSPSDLEILLSYDWAHTNKVQFCASGALCLCR